MFNDDIAPLLYVKLASNGDMNIQDLLNKMLIQLNVYIKVGGMVG